MTFYEYYTRMKAYEYIRVDELEDLHYHAWLVSRVVPGKDDKGRYILKTFEELFNKEERIKEITGEAQREKEKTFNRLRELQRRAQEYEKKGGKQ